MAATVTPDEVNLLVRPTDGESSNKEASFI